MTEPAAVALRKAMLARLSGSAPLAAAIGGAKIYDEAPRGAEAPYVLFADAQMRDWSTPGAPGAEHFVTLSVVSTARGTLEAMTIAGLVSALLDEAPLTLAGHALIDLRFVTSETRRDANGRFAKVNLRFRATTELTEA